MPPFQALRAFPGRPPSRRDWLRLGLPLAVAPLVAAKPATVRAKSVLVVFTSGGMSQLDTFDPKPDAPVEVRGAFGTIATRTPGVRFCEHLPELAARSNQFALVRSVTHDDADHGSACYLALTGQFHPRKSSNPPPSGTDSPAIAAVAGRVRPAGRFPYPAVNVNGPLLAPKEESPGQYGGLLGRTADPLELGDVSHGVTILAGLDRPADVSKVRGDRRQQLLASLDRKPADVHSDLARQAFGLLDDARVRTAFDLHREPPALRDKYGRYRGGQALLLARRLIEAGVPWVTAFFNHTIRGQDDSADADQYGWDTHNDIFDAMRHPLLPRLDRSFAALLDDLRQTGLLDETLVLCVGEFGRAPLVAVEKNFAGSSPGRKHWPRCYTVAMAGAGVVGGAVYGASDRYGAYPRANPVSPADLTATLLWAAGIDPAGRYLDPANRPHDICTGRPITGLFS